jgi:hypothetical protein
MEFSPDVEIRKISPLVMELFQKVLYDEEPLFISDVATLWGVSMSDPGEVLGRCSNYYGVPISLADSKQPLWQFLLMLDAKRKAKK